MIQYLNTKNIPCLLQPPRYILILHTRLKIATGVIMGYQDGRGTLTHSFPENLPLGVTCTQIPDPIITRSRPLPVRYHLQAY